MAGFTPIRTVIGGDDNDGFQPIRAVDLGIAPQKGIVMPALSSGVDQLQSIGYSAIGGLSDAVGANSVRDWANEQARRNSIDAGLNGRPDLERLEDQSLGTAAPYAAYQIIKQVPTIGAIMGAQMIPGVGQVATATGLARLGAVAPRAIGGGGLRAGADFAARRAALAQGESLGSQAAMGTALGYGSLYGESVEGGDPSPYASMAKAIPYGLAEAAVPAAVRGAMRVPANFSGGLGTRMAKAGGLGVMGEAGTEGFQNELEMSMRGDLSPEEIYSRRLNSIVAGGVVGGPLGSLGGIRTQVLKTVDEGPFDLTQRGNEGPAPQLGYSPLAGTPIVFPDGSIALNGEQELQKRYSLPATNTLEDIPAAADATDTSAPPAAPSTAFDDVDRALMDRGVKPNKLRKDLFTELQAANLDPDSETLSPFWTAMADGRSGKARKELAAAIIASKKEQTNVGTTSQPVAGPAPSVDAGGADVQRGLVNRGPVPSGAADGSGDAMGAGAAAPQTLAVPTAGAQPATVVNKQQSDPFQVSQNIQPAPLVDTSEDSREIAAMTGNSAETDAVYEDSEGLRADAPQAAAVDVDKVIAARLGKSKNAERDGKILRAYQTALRAPNANKLQIQQAIGKQFGVNASRVRQIGSPQALAEAGESLGYTKEQVLEALGVNDNAKGESSEISQLEYKLDTLKKEYNRSAKDKKQGIADEMARTSEQLAKAKEKAAEDRSNAVSSGLRDAGVEFDAEEGSGMGGLDEDRLWEKESAAGSKDAVDFIALADQIDALRASLEELEQQGMTEAAAAVQEQIDKAQADLEALVQQINTKGLTKPAPKAKAAAEEADEEGTTLEEVEPAAAGYQTESQRAGEAWDAVASEYPEAPAWADLTQSQRDTFIDYGEDNWTADDVQAELTKLAKTMSTPKSKVSESFSETTEDLDPSDVEIDNRLRGKSMDEAIAWAVSNARNEYESAIMRAVSARIAELKKLGVVFSFRLTDPGKQLTNGASGVSIATPAGLGEAMKVDVILNGSHVGSNSGANYETLVHELIHAATAALIKFAPNGSAAKQLQTLYSEIAQRFNARSRAGNMSEWEKKFWNKNNNSLTDADELLAWGLTNKEFQEYLASFDLTPKQNLWTRFVKLIGNVLGVPVRSNSALAQLMSVSENLFNESTAGYVQEANSRFQSLGRQANTTPWPNWTLNADHGAPVWNEGDFVLYRATSRTGAPLLLPGIRSGNTSAVAQVDVRAFTGAQIPAAMLSKMKSTADGLRQTASPMIRGNVTPKAVKPQVDQLTKSLRVRASELLNASMFSDDLFRRAANMGLKAAKDLGRLYQERAALTGKIERSVIRIEQMYNRIPEAFKGTGDKSANLFVYDTTREAKWGFQPDWRSDKVKIDPAMEARWNAMPKEAKAWISAVFKHGDEMLKMKQDALLNSASGVYDSRIAEAQKAGDTAKVAALEKEKKSELARFTRLLTANEGVPYAPLRRFGDWVVAAKSKAYLAAEAADDTAEMAKLQKSADDYHVTFAESYGSALELQRQLEAQGFTVTEPRKKEDARNDMYGGYMHAFDKLRGNLDAELSNTNDPKERAALTRAREVVTDLYLQSLAENSARKSEMRRRGIAGEIDMLRSFSTQGRADAHFLAAATFNPQMTQAVVKMRQEKNATGNGTEKSMAFREIMARHEQSMKYEDGGWYDVANKATAVTSAWMLVTSPMYYLQNLTQPGVISVPYMTGKHDYTAVWGQLLRAYHQLGDLVTSAKVGEGFDFTKVPADVRNAIQTLVERGRIDIGMDTELGKVKLEGDSLASKVGNRTSQFFRSLAQKAEAINRVSTAMAAYRLEMKRTNGDQEASLAYAEEVLSRTHGDYTRVNAPRLFNTPHGKVALQFRKFQLIQLSLLAKLAKDAFKGAKPEERAAARKMLAFTLGHTGVLAGVVGMPGFAAASFIINNLVGLFGDDDEPYNLENELRKAIGDNDVARVVLRGVPMAAGVDISGKVGMGTALSILPYSDMDMSRAGFNEIATGLTLGATGGLGARVWQSLGDIKNGDYYRGLAGLMPKGLADAYRAAYETNNGILRKNGDALVTAEEIDFAATFAKAIGLTTAKESERKFDQGVVYETKTAFEDRAAQIKAKYVKAQREQDLEAAGSLRNQWQKLQASRREAGFTTQPLSELLRAPVEQAKRNRNVSNGVQYDKQSRRFVEQQTQ